MHSSRSRLFHDMLASSPTGAAVDPPACSRSQCPVHCCATPVALVRPSSCHKSGKNAHTHTARHTDGPRMPGASRVRHCTSVPFGLLSSSKQAENPAFAAASKTRRLSPPRAPRNSHRAPSSRSGRKRRLLESIVMQRPTKDRSLLG